MRTEAAARLQVQGSQSELFAVGRVLSHEGQEEEEDLGVDLLAQAQQRQSTAPSLLPGTAGLPGGEGVQGRSISSRHGCVECPRRDLVEVLRVSSWGDDDGDVPDGEEVRAVTFSDPGRPTGTRR